MAIEKTNTIEDANGTKYDVVSLPAEIQALIADFDSARQVLEDKTIEFNLIELGRQQIQSRIEQAFNAWVSADQTSTVDNTEAS